MKFDLKPCPFCGGTAELYYTHTIYPHVVCSSEGCAACGPALYSPEAAVDAWNTRYNAPITRGEQWW